VVIAFRQRLKSSLRAEEMQNPSGVGVVRQSALDKAKATEKARKLRDEKEAASALEEFVKEFDADVSDETTTWRTGGVEGGMTHTSSHGAGARVSMPGRRHFTGAPKRVPPPHSPNVSGWWLIVG
jgi:hypothetical protein